MADTARGSTDLPWVRRFRTPQIAFAQIAPSAPGRGLVADNSSGAYQLYAWDGTDGTKRRLTDKPTGVLFGAIAGDGRHVYYHEDSGGDELGHFVRVPFEGGRAEDLCPLLPRFSSFSFASCGSGRRFGFQAADGEGFHVYDVETREDGGLGSPRELFRSGKLALGPAYSHDGEVAVVATTERSALQQYGLAAFGTADGRPLEGLWDGEGTSLEALGFPPIPGDLRLAGTSNRSGSRRPFVWDLATGERTDLPFAELPGELFAVDWSPDGRSLLLCQFHKAVQRLFVCDLGERRLRSLDHPRGTFDFFGATGTGTCFGSSDEVFALWQDSVHPARLVALDAGTGREKRTLLEAGAAVGGRAWSSVSFASSDGQEIQAWLGVPEGKGPFPAVVHSHGGPDAVMTEAYLPSSQAWLDSGFAFLTVNYRGSTCFGRDFQEKIWGEPGRWEVEDLAAARDWLVAEGVASPDAVFLSGWSYGGYNTLMGLGKRPELWAGGMAGVAIADWNAMYEDSAETLRGYQAALFGGAPEEKPEAYAECSPIAWAEKVAAPLLVIQGANDTRTPARQMRLYEARMRELGKRIEVRWFEAGHLGAGVEKDIEHMELMLGFAKAVVEGRDPFAPTSPGRPPRPATPGPAS